MLMRLQCYDQTLCWRFMIKTNLNAQALPEIWAWNVAIYFRTLDMITIFIS